MGDSMKEILKKRDRENNFRNEYRQKKEVKKKRKHGDTTKRCKGIAERKKQISSGAYKSGLAIQTEQKAKEMVRKLKESAQKIKTNDSKGNINVCKYYPHFCKVIGHTSARCKKCEMYGTSKEEKTNAMRHIEQLKIAAQIQTLKSEGK